MVGILIIAHGTLGEALIQCAAHVLGATPERVGSIPVIGRADPEKLLAQARAEITRLDDGQGVLILTDMVGGSPSNVTTRALASGRVAAASGVNLPMLVRALNYRQQPLATVLAKALSGGQAGVIQLEQ